jgi:16S rRNA (uracil1498-N3)-methyltransferase
MTRRRFYASPIAIDQTKQIVNLDKAEARHLTNVLRLHADDEVFVFDGIGQEFRCLVTEATGKSGTLSLVEAVAPARPESPLRITLAVGLLKGEKFDLVVQKATELGVSRIIPILTARSDVRLPSPSAATSRVERWNRLAMEAAKQSGRALVPVCEPPRKFADVIAKPPADGEARVMFTERRGGGFDQLQPSQLITALVGPEGGWSDEELDQAAAIGWTLVTLGGRILRAETAAITVAGILQHRFGDLH